MALGYCTVRVNVGALIIDGVDDNDEFDDVPVAGNMVLTPMLDPGKPVQVDDNGVMKLKAIAPFAVDIGLSGDVSHRGRNYVKVPAPTSATSNLSKLQWRASFNGLKFGLTPVSLPQIFFWAEPGVDVNLADHINVGPSSTSMQLSRGPRGFGVKSVEADGGDMVFRSDADGAPEIGRVPLPVGSGGQPDTVDTLGGTGAAGRSVMKAADAAAIRALIDAVTPAQVSAAVAALVDSSPATLDTLKELAGALGNDPNFAATIAWQIGAKYTKPASGIPLADLVAAVQTSLGKADTASQSGHKHAAADLTATGTLDATTFLRGDNTWAVPSGGGAANVELAYAEVATKIPLGATSAFEDAPGLAITFAPGSRPAMVDAYLATVAAFNSATWGFRVVRTSDNRVMAEGVCNTTSAVGYPPSPQLRFRVAAGAASATYKVQTCMWEGTAPGALNAQAEAGSGHRAYISAVSV